MASNDKLWFDLGVRDNVSKALNEILSKMHSGILLCIFYFELKNKSPSKTTSPTVNMDLKLIKPMH